MPKLMTAWTDDRIGTLMRMWEQSYSCSQIATELGGTTRNAVIGKIHRLGLSGRPSRPNQYSQPRMRSAPKPPTLRLVAAKPRRVPIMLPDEIQIRCAEIVPRNIALMDLEPADCRYPVTDDLPYLFCGHPKGERSYCLAHDRLTRMVTRPTFTEEQKREKRRIYTADYRASKRIQLAVFG